MLVDNKQKWRDCVIIFNMEKQDMEKYDSPDYVR